MRLQAVVARAGLGLDAVPGDLVPGTQAPRGGAVAWLAAMSKGTDHFGEPAKVGPTFESLGEQCLDGVDSGHTGRRRRRVLAASSSSPARQTAAADRLSAYFGHAEER